jgi:hypothetical protein
VDHAVGDFRIQMRSQKRRLIACCLPQRVTSIGAIVSARRWRPNSLAKRQSSLEMRASTKREVPFSQTAAVETAPAVEQQR